MKFLKFLSFLMTISLFGQATHNDDYLINYELKYRPDSTNLNFYRTEHFILIANKTSSLFTSYVFYHRDSIIQAFGAKHAGNANINLSTLPRTRFKSYVVKSPDSTDFYEMKLNYKFHYAEPPMRGWVLGDKNKTIGTFEVRNAILRYGGRTWEAWYTTEIPLQDGPYKFRNLPGLIIEIHDEKNNYRFKLVEVRKTNKDEQTFLSSFNKEKSQFKLITKKKYTETMKTLNENIFSELANVGITFDEANKKKVIQNRKANNNPIELEE